MKIYESTQARSREIVIIDDGTAYCAVNVYEPNTGPTGDEQYVIDGRFFDCCSMPAQDWFDGYHDDEAWIVTDDTALDMAFVTALGNTKRYLDNGCSH